MEICLQLTAHSTQKVPLATGTLQAQKVTMAAGGRGGLAASPHRGEEGRTGQAHEGTMVPWSSVQTQGP